MNKLKKKLIRQKKMDIRGRTYTFSQVQEIAHEHANNALYDFLGAVGIVLRDEYKFGAKRLERFYRRVSNHAQCIRDNYVSGRDIFLQIQNETGFDFEEFHNKLEEELNSN